MKKLIGLVAIAIITLLAYQACGLSEFAAGVQEDAQKMAKFKKQAAPKYQFGDIIFQSSESGQSKAIQLATDSKYSHVGMLFQEDKEWMVLEAVQPVRITALSRWIPNGDRNEFVVKRLVNADSLLTEEVIEDMTKSGKEWIGKNYDIYFDWSDDELYCSELVWKLYEEHLGVEIGTLRPLKDFDLSHPIVKEIMKKRYGNNVPLESMMISPGDMFDSKFIRTVYRQ